MHSDSVKRLQKVSFMAALVLTHYEAVCVFTFNYLFFCFLSLSPFTQFSLSFFYHLYFSPFFPFPLSVLLPNFVKAPFMKDKSCQCDDKLLCRFSFLDVLLMLEK